MSIDHTLTMCKVLEKYTAGKLLLNQAYNLVIMVYLDHYQSQPTPKIIFGLLGHRLTNEDLTTLELAFDGDWNAWLAKHSPTGWYKTRTEINDELSAHERMRVLPGQPIHMLPRMRHRTKTAKARRV